MWQQGFNLVRHRQLCEIFIACATASKAAWKVAKGSLPYEPGCKKREIWTLKQMCHVWDFLKSIRTLARKRSVCVGKVALKPLRK